MSSDGSKKLINLFNNERAKSLDICHHNTIMIDDKAHVFVNNTGNGFIIPEYIGNKSDKFLLKLIKLLTLIQKEKLVIDINQDSIILSDINVWWYWSLGEFIHRLCYSAKQAQHK